jgi:hypothetical protein
MDTTHRSDDGGDNFAALDFGDESSYDGAADLDFGDEPGFDTDDAWTVDALPADTGDTEDTDAEDDEFPWELTTVTNPPESVSVTALMDGRIHGVELSPDAGSMTESELATEVLVIADLASRRASSVLHTLLLESLKAQGLDSGFTDLVGNRFLDLTSPEQATKAQAEVFATRYAYDSKDAR